ncbi:pleckstrin homology domain-containing family G member 3-like isoform X1 [Stigmatopora argus]
MAPTYLERVVSEIIETERTYVTDLRMIVEDYLAHVIEQAELSVRPEQVCFLFGNIEDIYEFNSELLQDLDLCRRDAVAVARCFVSKSQYFDIYTQYCTNYPNSVAALTACMRDQSLAGFFRERQAASERPLPLGSYLLKPVQRILKYHLLLQEIAKHFDPEDEGYEVVEEAICAMTAVAWYINDMKRKHEHAVRLQEVQSLLLNWKGPELTWYGELVLEGSFKVHRAKNQRTLFLLERVLLITKRRGQHYVYKTHIACSALMLIESAKDTLSFSVTHYKQPKRPHTVQAKSADEKTTWAQHIKRVILENHHDIIPQKAKDAILNSQHPRKYRRGPQRAEKVRSSSSDPFPRRRSADVDREAGAGADADADAGAGRANERSEETERGDLSSDDSNGERGLAEKAGAPPPPSRQTTAEGGRPLSRGSPPAPGREDPESAPAASGGESSSDEDVEKEAGGSILPPSVLDKAGAIARHFAGADAADAAGSPPRRRLSFHGPPPARDPPLRSPGGFRRAGGAAQPRADSGLSGRERLLIGKIRNYYDNAESGDAAFGLRRRESLTYIPAGLVKTSVGRLNEPPAGGGRGPAKSKGRAVRGDLPDGGKVARAEPEESTARQNAKDEEWRTSGERLRLRLGDGGHHGRPRDEGALQPRPPDGGLLGPEDADGKVRHLARRYSRRLRSDEAPAGRGVGDSFTGQKALAGVPEESAGFRQTWLSNHGVTRLALQQDPGRSQGRRRDSARPARPPRPPSLSPPKASTGPTCGSCGPSTPRTASRNRGGEDVLCATRGRNPARASAERGPSTSSVRPGTSTSAPKMSWPGRSRPSERRRRRRRTTTTTTAARRTWRSAPPPVGRRSPSWRWRTAVARTRSRTSTEREVGETGPRRRRREARWPRARPTPAVATTAW